MHERGDESFWCVICSIAHRFREDSDAASFDNDLGVFQQNLSKRQDRYTAELVIRMICHGDKNTYD